MSSNHTENKAVYSTLLGLVLSRIAEIKAPFRSAFCMLDLHQTLSFQLDTSIITTLHCQSLINLNANQIEFAMLICSPEVINRQLYH